MAWLDEAIERLTTRPVCGYGCEGSTDRRADGAGGAGAIGRRPRRPGDAGAGLAGGRAVHRRQPGDRPPDARALLADGLGHPGLEHGRPHPRPLSRKERGATRCQSGVVGRGPPGDDVDAERQRTPRRTRGRGTAVRRPRHHAPRLALGGRHALVGRTDGHQPACPAQRGPSRPPALAARRSSCCWIVNCPRAAGTTATPRCWATCSAPRCSPPAWPWRRWPARRTSAPRCFVRSSGSSTRLPQRTTTASLCYALMGLAAHGLWPQAANGWLQSAYRRTLARHGSPYHVALLVLTA